MPVESASDRAGFFDTGEFGVSIIWTVGAVAATIPVLAASNALMMEGGDGPGLLNSEATLLCSDEDVPDGWAVGNAVTYAGAAHTLKTVEPDGTGMSIVRLEEVVAD
jgi:hypothetical protein